MIIMERKLATVETILDIQPIEGADAIEVAMVRGWKIVVKKGDFKVGDLCVYCEVDSLMPRKPEYEFLAPRGYRIRTIKLRGQISQGIAFPLQILPRDFFAPGQKIVPVAGLDVTDALGVIKYEPPVSVQLAGLVKGSFPGFLPKTDEERIQNIPWVLEKYPTVDFYATEKLDGSSVTLYLNNGEFGVCSRNLELKETEDNTIWKTVRKMDLSEKCALPRHGHLRPRITPCRASSSARVSRRTTTSWSGKQSSSSAHLTSTPGNTLGAIDSSRS